ncbi:MAG: DUF6715 family protein [Roseburia sp.]
MKKVRVVVVAIICVSLIVAYYYYLTTKSGNKTEGNVELTEVDKIVTRDLEKDYPETPREVVKLYNRIITCYYKEDYTEEELYELGDQARALFDEELLENNPREQYFTDLKAEIAEYEENQKQISQSGVCSSSDVLYKTVDGDECAYVTASYFIKEGKNYNKTYQEYVLRKDEDGDWKILVFYQIEGDSSNE